MCILIGLGRCAGVPREDAKDAIFWDMFEVRNPHTGELAEPWVPCEAAAARRQKFVLHKVRVSRAGSERLLTMRFRCAPPPQRLSAGCCLHAPARCQALLSLPWRFACSHPLNMLYCAPRLFQARSPAVYFFVSGPAALARAGYCNTIREGLRLEGSS